jgi:hypothetical protein
MTSGSRHKTRSVQEPVELATKTVSCLASCEAPGLACGSDGAVPGRAASTAWHWADPGRTRRLRRNDLGPPCHGWKPKFVRDAQRSPELADAVSLPVIADVLVSLADIQRPRSVPLAHVELGRMNEFPA